MPVLPKGIRYNNLFSALVSIAGAATMHGIAPDWVKGVFIFLAVIALILSIEPVSTSKPS